MAIQSECQAKDIVIESLWSGLAGAWAWAAATMEASFLAELVAAQVAGVCVVNYLGLELLTLLPTSLFFLHAIFTSFIIKMYYHC